MKLNDLIRSLENMKHRGPNADVYLMEVSPEGIRNYSLPIFFGELDTMGTLINPGFDPLETYNSTKNLHALVIFGADAVKKVNEG